jgi:hypothetical protein
MFCGKENSVAPVCKASAEFCANKEDEGICGDLPWNGKQILNP